MSYKELDNIINNIEVRTNLIELKKLLKDDTQIQKVKEDENYSIEAFQCLLMNEDPKVRKNAVLIMGMLKDNAFAPIIYQGYLLENTMFVKSSYLKALKNYDYSEYVETLFNRRIVLENGNFEEGELKHVAEELHELKTMLDEEESHEKHVFKNPESAVSIILSCKKELSELLIKEVDEIVGRKLATKAFCGIAVKSKDVGKIAAIRYYKEMFFPLNGLKASSRENLIKDILDGDLFKLLAALHEDIEGAFYFRLSGNQFDCRKIARELEAASKGRLINSVSDYEIELKLIENKEGKIGILLKLFTRKDKRFLYRKNSIATSFHPVNAAAVIKLAEKYLEKHCQVLDPFCGVGTLLIERHKKMPAKYLYGTDIYGEAISAARENGDLAKQEINFIQRDYFDFKHDYLFDEIITEMPKLEREEKDNFYRRFFEKSSSLLRNNGLIICVSNEMGILKKQVRLHREFEVISEIVYDSKEGIYVFIIKKQVVD